MIFVVDMLELEENDMYNFLVIILIVLLLCGDFICL